MENNEKDEKVLTILDTLHNCLMCNSKAYEYEENKFICSDKECNFKWRVS